MKKWLSLVLALSIMMSVIIVVEPQAAHAQTDVDNLWEYEQYSYNGETGVVLTKYNGTATDIYVPGKITEGEITYNVLKLGNGIFENNTAVNSVTLGSGIKVIGESAFRGATNLVCIVTNETLEIIEDSAFLGCTNFNSIILFDKVLQIYGNAFKDCSALTIYCSENSVAHNYAIENQISFVIIGVDAEPEIVVVSGITYYIGNGEAIAMSCDENTRGAVTIPAQIEGYPVTKINNSAFQGSSITSIHLPETVIHIGEHAFQQCFYLEKVVIPSGITKINDYVFDNCWALEQIELPKEIDSIGIAAFSGCRALQSIELPENITKIPESAFIGCRSLASIYIPRTVNVIEVFAFDFCTSLTDIYFGGSREEWEQIAIAASNGDLLNASKHYAISVPVEGVRLEDTVINVGETQKLNPIFEPASPSNQNAEWTSSDSSIISVNQSGEITALSEGTVTITMVTQDGGFTASCNVTSIFFQGETGPLHFLLDGEGTLIISGNGEMPNYERTADSPAPWSEKKDRIKSILIEEGVTRIGDKAFNNAEKLEKVTLPETLSEIGGYAFFRCTSLSEIDIPSKLTSIEYAAFEGCRALEQILLPDTLTTLQPYAFSDCLSLKSINIPNCITNISMEAFSGCPLETLYLPESVTRIDNSAFSGCKLQTVDLPARIEYIGTNAFDCSTLTEINVSEDNPYYSSENGILYDKNKTTLILYPSNHAQTSYIMPKTITEIPASSFSGRKNLLEVIIPEGVTTIQPSTFSECRSIRKIVLPSTISELSYRAFYNCEHLEEINIPLGIQSIPDETFNGCASLKKIEIPDTVKEIGYGAFSLCRTIESIIIPEGVTTINRNTFNWCLSLQDVVIPDSVTKIDTGAFQFCQMLKNITIPESVTEIASAAFQDCKSLETVVLPGNISTLGSKAFSGCTALNRIILPDSISSIGVDAFYGSPTILCVYRDSYAMQYAMENNVPYFIIHKTMNPEISYGTEVSGTITYTDGTPVSEATVEILYDDGALKESVTTDANGGYTFTYAEVGSYTLRATDNDGNVGTELISIKRKNVFDVFLAGETNIVIKQGWNISGSVTPTDKAVITLTDTDANFVASTESENGAYALTDIPNGTYIIKAENATGSMAKEVTVFNGDVTENIIIPVSSATIEGYVEAEGRNGDRSVRIWADVTLYDSDGIAVANTKTDETGYYSFGNLSPDTYYIVAQAGDIRSDHLGDYERTFTLTGYAYVNVAELKIYTANIVLFESAEGFAEISGKVTAQGENQACDVVLSDVFQNEIARYITSKNGKYSFKNLADGLYYITAITKSDGVGFGVVLVLDGQIYGTTDIFVYKSEKISNHEAAMNAIPDCSTREQAMEYKEEIIEEKQFYDRLPEKEKKEFSQAYIDKLNHLTALIADLEINTGENVDVNYGGLILSADEINNENAVSLEIGVTPVTSWTIGADGITTDEEYMQQSIEDLKGNRYLGQYYEISLTKEVNGNRTQITNIPKNTDTTGKLRITMQIPDEYKGHKNYSFVHVHNGIPTTLVDLDDNPDTMTFETDKFSTFALMYDDIDNTPALDSGSIISDESGKIKVSAQKDATLYIATFSADRLEDIRLYDIAAGTTDAVFEIAAGETAFLWDDNLSPLCEEFKF